MCAHINMPTPSKPTTTNTAGEGEHSRWAVDNRASIISASSTKALRSKNNNSSTLVMPFGSDVETGVELAKKSVSGRHDEAAKQKALKHKLAWNLALKPASSLPMSLFMMWMMGSSVTLVSLSHAYNKFITYVRHDNIKAHAHTHAHVHAHAHTHTHNGTHIHMHNRA